jgi:hypothetical protein
MPLNTRPPTGLAAWPLILVGGPPKVGRSCLAYELSASDRVGHTFLFPVGERNADEYQALGPYQIVEWDGTWAGFYDQLVEATRVPMVDGKPNVIIIDTATRLWTDLRNWVDQRARNSEANRKKLAKDPDAAIDRGQNLWNDANERWDHMLDLLNRWDGIAVLVARGDEVTEYADGSPTGALAYRDEVQKSTPSNVTAIVRVPSYRAPVLMGVTRLGVEIPKGGLELPRDGALEHLIFEVLGTTVAGSEARSAVGAAPGGLPGAPVVYPENIAKQHVAAVFRDEGGYAKEDVAEPAVQVWRRHYPEGVHVDEVPRTVLLEMLDEARQSIAEAAAAPPQAPAATEPAAATEEPESDDTAPPDPTIHCDEHDTYTRGCGRCQVAVARHVKDEIGAPPAADAADSPPSNPDRPLDDGDDGYTYDDDEGGS